MKEPLVSVIITTRNEERHIANCLNSIAAQTYKNIEVIVVDNQSSDQTKQIARKHTSKVHDKGPERSAQRNYGIVELAQGDYAMYVDADMILGPEVIAACVAQLSAHDYVALYVPELVMGSSTLCKVRRFERSFYDGTVIDAVRFFNRKKFIETGGFDESMSGPEDWDLDKKIKALGQVAVIDSAWLSGDSFDQWQQKFTDLIHNNDVSLANSYAAIFHNEAENEIGEYLKKKSYYAGSFDKYIKKWGADDPDLRKQLGLGYRYFGVFLEKGKWKMLLTHPILAIGMYALRFLVGVSFLLRKRS